MNYRLTIYTLDNAFRIRHKKGPPLNCQDDEQVKQYALKMYKETPEAIGVSVECNGRPIFRLAFSTRKVVQMITGSGQVTAQFAY